MKNQVNAHPTLTELKLRVLLESLMPVIEAAVGPNSFTATDAREAIAASKLLEDEYYRNLFAQINALKSEGA